MTWTVKQWPRNKTESLQSIEWIDLTLLSNYQFSNWLFVSMLTFIDRRGEFSNFSLCLVKVFISVRSSAENQTDILLLSSQACLFVHWMDVWTDWLTACPLTFSSLCLLWRNLRLSCSVIPALTQSSGYMLVEDVHRMDYVFEHAHTHTKLKWNLYYHSHTFFLSNAHVNIAAAV